MSVRDIERKVTRLTDSSHLVVLCWRGPNRWTHPSRLLSVLCWVRSRCSKSVYARCASWSQVWWLQQNLEVINIVNSGNGNWNGVSWTRCVERASQLSRSHLESPVAMIGQLSTREVENNKDVTFSLNIYTCNYRHRLQIAGIVSISINRLHRFVCVEFN